MPEYLLKLSVRFRAKDDVEARNIRKHPPRWVLFVVLPDKNIT